MDNMIKFKRKIIWLFNFNLIDFMYLLVGDEICFRINFFWGYLYVEFIVFSECFIINI